MSMYLFHPVISPKEYQKIRFFRYHSIDYVFVSNLGHTNQFYVGNTILNRDFLLYFDNARLSFFFYSRNRFPNIGTSTPNYRELIFCEAFSDYLKSKSKISWFPERFPSRVNEGVISDRLL